MSFQPNTEERNPNERNYLTCNRCTEIAPRGGEWFQCATEGCKNDVLCIGCIYQCGVCEDDFCRRHIVEIPDSRGFARYECETCHSKQAEVAKVA